MSSDSTSADRPSEYLKQDSGLPGQNYVLLSFAEPRRNKLEDRIRYEVLRWVEELLRNDEQVVEMQMKLEARKDDEMKKRLDILLDDQLGHLQVNGEQLRREFAEQYGPETSLRALKIRGTFAMRNDAEEHAKKLTENDKVFDIYVGEVGKWVPAWPENIRTNGIKEVYDEEKLNTLLEENYRAQQDAKLQFDSRKEEMTNNPESEESAKKRKVTKQQKMQRLRELRKRRRARH